MYNNKFYNNDREIIKLGRASTINSADSHYPQKATRDHLPRVGGRSLGGRQFGPLSSSVRHDKTIDDG